MSDDAVFKALADPSRRLLLDQLFQRDGRTLGQLEAELPAMTRFGVMKHLKVLEAAGLVVTRRAGRAKFHYLNSVPVQQIYDRWVSKYTAARTAALIDLKQTLEGGINMNASSKQVYQVFIRATPEQVWEAITKPEFTAQYFYGSRVDTNAEAGSPIRYYAPDGNTIWVDDSVIESVRPTRFVHTWRALYNPELAAEPPSRVTWEIEPQPGGVTRLTVVHDQLEGSPKTSESVSGGWMFIISGLKTLLETGKPLAQNSTGAQTRS
ncbi:MAG: ArsR/SmtB family transcription factor [Candidatus Dormibacteraceae bacterium]